MPTGDIGIIVDEYQIKKYIDIMCDDVDDKVWKDHFKGWKYQLCLGREAYLSTDDSPKHLKRGEYITIKPGDFALLISKEKINLPDDVMAFISMRFDYKQKGLINVSGFHVDPNYKGQLIFSAFNAGPREIVIREGDPVFMIFFQKLCGRSKTLHEGFSYIPSAMIEAIRGRTTTLASNATRLDKIEFHIMLIGGVSTAVLILLLGLALKEILK